MKTKAVFLDRDGVINKNPPHGDFVTDPAMLDIPEGVGAALRRLTDAGFVLVVVSNQSGVGRGIFTHEELDAVSARMREILAADGVELAAIHACPHAPQENCDCRKPSPTMILRAAEELDIDLQKSWMLGDSARDIESGKRAGTKTIYLSGDVYEAHESAARESGFDAQFTTLDEAVDYILEQSA